MKTESVAEKSEIILENEAGVQEFTAKLYTEFYKYMESKEYSLALKNLHEFEKKMSVGNLPDNRKYEYLIRASAVYLANRQLEGALEKADAAIKILPDKPDAYGSKASALESWIRQKEEQGENKNIIEHYRDEQRSALQRNAELLEKEFGSDDSLMLQIVAASYDELSFSFCFYEPTNMDKAEYFAQSAIKCNAANVCNSEMVLIWLKIGDALVHKDLDTAVDLLDKAIKEGLSPGCYQVKAVMGIIASMSGDFANAVIYSAPVIGFWNDKSDAVRQITRGITVYDLWEAVEYAFFALKDYGNEKKLLDKMAQDDGKLSGAPAGRALSCEHQLNGLDAALSLAKLYADISDSAENYETYNAFKMGTAKVYFDELECNCDPNTHKLLPNISIEFTQHIAGYILNMIDALECVKDGYKDKPRDSMLILGQEWLGEVVAKLYVGKREDNLVEMEVNKNYYAAEDCFRCTDKLVRMGKTELSHLLGTMYFYGRGTQKDEAKAFYWMQKSMDGEYKEGREASIRYMPYFYFYGIGTEQDYQKAFTYARELAEKGDIVSEKLLGIMYLDGKGTEQDIEKGLSLLQKAAYKGDEDAVSTLLKKAEETIDDFSEKQRFLQSFTKRDYDSLESGLPDGKRYLDIYMEIEKYWVMPAQRMWFLAFCTSAQPELVYGYGGSVTYEYYIDQFDKCIMENSDRALLIAKKFINSNLTGIALMELTSRMAADASIDFNKMNWRRILDYIADKALSLGWDGYYDDGGKYTKVQSGPDDKNPETSSSKKDNPSTVNAGSNGGCYIATAVYGSYDCPEVWILRRYRDDRLSVTWQGRFFIRCYYAVSPTLVRLFGKTDFFSSFWRKRLDKAIAILKHKGYKDTPYIDNENIN